MLWQMLLEQKLQVFENKKTLELHYKASVFSIHSALTSNTKLLKARLFFVDIFVFYSWVNVKYFEGRCTR